MDRHFERSERVVGPQGGVVSDGQRVATAYRNRVSLAAA